MDHNNIEKGLKDQLQGYESLIDTNSIWDNIEGEIPKKKKKRRFAFWWFFSGVVLTGLLFFLSTHLLDRQGNEVVSTEVKATENKQQTAHKQEEEEYCPEDHLVSEQLAQADLSSEGPDHANKTVNRSEKTRVRKTRKNTAPYSSNRGYKQPDAATSNSNASTGNSSWFTTSGKGAISGFPPSGTRTPDLSENTATPNQTTPSTKEQLETEVNSTNTKDKTSKTKAQKPGNSKEKNDKDKNKKTKNSNSNKNKPEVTKKKTPSKKKRKRRKWTNTVELYLAGDIPFKNLKNLGEYPISLLETRQETEKVLYGYHGGINYKGFHKNGFLVKTGLQYQQIDEKMELIEEKQEERIVQVLESVTINANLDTINRVYKPTEMMVTVLQTKRIYNRYRMLNLPIMIGGRIERKKWDVEFAAGFDVNLLYFQKGQIKHLNDRFSNLQYLLNKPSVGVGLLGSMSIQRPIAENVSFYIEPNIKQMLGSMSPKTYFIKQRYTFLGLKAGLQFKF